MENATVVVDTDLLVDFLRRSEPGTSVVRGFIAQDRLVITAVSVYELRAGSPLDPQMDQRVAAVLERNVVPADKEAAMAAGAIEHDLRARGERIGFADSLIAGICISNDLPLATRNTRHFERVRGLELVDISAGA